MAAPQLRPDHALLQRIDLAVSAAIEVESISRVLQATFQTAGAELKFVLGLAIRLESLSSVVLALGHTDQLDEELNTLHGPEAARLRMAGAR